MGLTISTNIASMVSMRRLNEAMGEQAKTYEKLASGQRIVRAADDASGLSIAENMRYQIRALNQAKRNATDAISFTQAAEGAMNEMGNIMVRLRELGTQAASDTIGDHERQFINNEAQTLLQEVDRIASVTKFNNIPLLNGQSDKDKLRFQVGFENSESSQMTLDVNALDSRTSTLGLDGLNFESIDNALESFEKVDTAVNKLFENRAALAGMQSNLHSSISNLETTVENFAEARSNIADADIAEETSKLVRGNILQSAGIAVLTQANQAPTQALKLL